MNFYVDFEATQFSERIISFGCVAEDGETFFSLVQPLSQWRITSFITELTGITAEQIKTAPNTNEVFHSFYTWVENKLWISTERPNFICYGNCDGRFIERTLKDVTDRNAAMALANMLINLKDYSGLVAEKFGGQIGLKRAYNTIKEINEPQNHDALEDAKMLKYVLENLPSEPVKELAAPVYKPKPVASAPKGDIEIPEFYNKWATPKGKKVKFEVDTFANEDDWKYKVTDSMGLHTVYFNSLEIMSYWVVKYLKQGKPYISANLKNIRDNIVKSFETGKMVYGFKWEEKGENFNDSLD